VGLGHGKGLFEDVEFGGEYSDMVGQPFLAEEGVLLDNKGEIRSNMLR
jgi:hypothetical protein